jgi:hypothetical protein
MVGMPFDDEEEEVEEVEEDEGALPVPVDDRTTGEAIATAARTLPLDEVLASLPGLMLTLSTASSSSTSSSPSPANSWPPPPAEAFFAFTKRPCNVVK